MTGSTSGAETRNTQLEVEFEPEETGSPPGNIAEVALNLPLDEALDYKIPDEHQETITPGVRVKVPLGSRTVMGFCVGRKNSSPHKKLRSILEVLDDSPLVDEDLISLARWIADYYCCSLGEALAATVPAPVRRATKSQRLKTEPALELAREVEEVHRAIEDLSPRFSKQAEVLRFVLRSEGPAPIREVRKRARVTRSPITTLIRKGLVRQLDIEVEQLPFAPEGVSDDEEKATPPELTPEQSQALEQIQHHVRTKAFKTVLVLGVTGSGKTELYLRAIENTLAAGRKAIVLLPEIALTPQTVRRFFQRFSRIAVLHSHLSDADRLAHWNRIRKGEADVVIGARSAVFAPVDPLGILIVDEEHEPSYKQQSIPRYHARDLAIVRAKRASAVVLLGSATPSLESFENARTGKFDLTHLSKRVGGRTLPEVQVIDMGKEHAESHRFSLFSRRLTQAMRTTLDRGEQVLLFLNRRGFASIVRCKRCGRVESCPNCDITLTFHQSIRRLLCHYCGTEARLPTECADCGMPGLRYTALGTEHIEEELRELFPDHPTARMDSDSMQGIGSYEKTLTAFGRGEIKILLGTQMIAKGHDFPNVTLVGILLADIGLNIPDFRASERTFQLVAQCAGRSGRGDVRGIVILQAYSVEHPALVSGSRQDFHEFADKELKDRKALRYPPFGRLARIIVRSTKEAAAKERMGLVLHELKGLCERDGIQILGPAPLFRLRGEHRFHILLKAQKADVLVSALHWVRRQVKTDKTTHVLVDMDPSGSG